MPEDQENNINTQAQTATYTPVNNVQTNNYQANSIPNEYKPLSPWAYVGYNLLFSIPIIGFIMLIVFSFDSSRINRRNYARSYFCAMLIGIILSIILLVLAFGVFGLSYSEFSKSIR